MRNEMAYLSTPDEKSNGKPYRVWESLMDRPGSKPPTCLDCEGRWCDGCSADPLSAHERQMLRA
jgi:hypothetical protein